MQQYLNLLEKIQREGDRWRQTRNGETVALFGEQLRFDLRDGFPAMTTKKLAFDTVKAELLWFLEGSTDVNRLKEIAGKNVKIWDGDAEQHMEKGKAAFAGDLGPIYGKQWRSWQAFRFRKGRGVPYVDTDWIPDAWEPFEIDQIKDVIERLKQDPFDRRLIVNAWNVGEIDNAALPPCHIFFQLFTTTDRRLSLSMYQRSCDMFLGVPFNIASYALLLSMIAQVTDFEPWELIIDFGDAHIYRDHLDAVDEQIVRDPLSLPTLGLNPNVRDIDKFTMDDIQLVGYTHHPHIPAPLLTKDVKK